MNSRKTVFMVLITILLVNFVFGQLDNFQQKLFEEAADLQQELEIVQAPLLSPTYYNDAMEAYNEAQIRYKKGKSLRSIEKLLTKFTEKAEKAKEIARTAKTFFISTLNARNEALQFKADEASKELFDKAEEKFKNASKEYEDSDLNDARKKAKEAENLYVEASRQSIKTSLLDEARIYLQEAKHLEADKYTAKTYFHARQLLQQVEEILNNNYKAGTRVRSIAEEATYEAKHAIVLTKAISKLKKNDAHWELILLMFEDVLTNISAEFNYQPMFNRDFDKDVKKVQSDIITAIQNIKEENLQLKQELTQLHEEKDKIDEELRQLQSTQQKMTKELEMKKELEDKIAQLEKLFEENEAQVLRSGDKVIIRLYGLSFPSGKSDILPAYFQLLTRVQKAIRTLSVEKVVIEGHTDAIGNDSYNLNLSQLRANSIRAYLLANMGIEPEFIEAIGYGKARPIAPNDTPENRAKNRRIDIVLILKNTTTD